MANLFSKLALMNLLTVCIAFSVCGQYSVNRSPAPEIVPLSIRPFVHSSVKKGDPIIVRWFGGSPVGRLKIELHKDGKIVKTLVNDLDNVDKWTWDTSTSKIGKRYSIKIIDSLTNIASVSEKFRVRPKVRFVVKTLPFIAAGVIIYMLQPKPLTDLPAPVDPN